MPDRNLKCAFSGAFIIPFLVMLLLVGMPLLLLELALGQKLRVGAARAWYKVSEDFRYLGPCQGNF